MVRTRLKSLLLRHTPTLFNALRDLGTGKFEVFPPRRTYAHGDLHRELLNIFAHRDGTFFEVGANDGVYGSNTAYLEKFRGWRGILVEAVPNLFVECLANRPAALNVHAALVPHNFTDPYIEIAYAHQMSLTALSELRVEDHLAAAIPHLRDRHALAGQIFLAPARTAASVIEQSGLTEIDFFSLDVEGAELSVLNGIDFTRVAPKYFLIELWQPDDVTKFLAEKGYEPLGKLAERDYLFRRT